MSDEIYMRNFKAIKQEFIVLKTENDKRVEEIRGLQGSAVNLLSEIQVLKQRIAILQSGQVLGGTSGD